MWKDKPTCLSVGLSVGLSLGLLVFQFICWSGLSVFQSTSSSVWSVSLSVFQSAFRSGLLVGWSVGLSVYLSVWSTSRRSVGLSVCRSVGLSVYRSVGLSDKKKNFDSHITKTHLHKHKEAHKIYLFSNQVFVRATQWICELKPAFCSLNKPFLFNNSLQYTKTFGSEQKHTETKQLTYACL